MTEAMVDTSSMSDWPSGWTLESYNFPLIVAEPPAAFPVQGWTPDALPLGKVDLVNPEDLEDLQDAYETAERYRTQGLVGFTSLRDYKRDRTSTREQT
jgi:hypothetical protein